MTEEVNIRLARMEGKQDEALAKLGDISTELRVEIAGGRHRQQQIDELKRQMHDKVDRDDFKDFRDGQRWVQRTALAALIAAGVGWLTKFFGGGV